MFKLKSSIFDNAQPDSLCGDLGYPGLFKEFHFKVNKIKEAFSYCEITNLDEVAKRNGWKATAQGEMRLLTKDLEEV